MADPLPLWPHFTRPKETLKQLTAGSHRHAGTHTLPPPPRHPHWSTLATVLRQQSCVDPRNSVQHACQRRSLRRSLLFSVSAEIQAGFPSGNGSSAPPDRLPRSLLLTTDAEHLQDVRASTACSAPYEHCLRHLASTHTLANEARRDSLVPWNFETQPLYVAIVGIESDARVRSLPQAILYRWGSPSPRKCRCQGRPWAPLEAIREGRLSVIPPAPNVISPSGRLGTPPTTHGLTWFAALTVTIRLNGGSIPGMARH
jgi:hypothetical protein